ncbi:hypothetical protein ABPG72_020927 [Tetrahymena utriculariae]
MGIQQFRSKDIAQDKRDWIAFFIGLLQISEFISLANAAIMVMYEGLIFLPLIMILFICLKKILIVGLHRTLNFFSSSQNMFLTLIGFTPRSITQYYFYLRTQEFLLHHYVTFVQIDFIVMHGNDGLSFLAAFILGFLSYFSVINYSYYLKYKNNFTLLIQSIEISIGGILNASLVFLCLKDSITGLLFLIAIITENIWLLRKYGQGQYYVYVSQIFGFNRIKLRDKHKNKIYKDKKLSSKRIAAFGFVCQSILLIIVDFLLNDIYFLKKLRYLIYVCFILYIPSSTYIIKKWVQFIKYGTHIKSIEIYEEEIKDNPIALDKFTNFQKHENQINYTIFEAQFDIFKPILNKVINDQSRFFSFFIYQQGVLNQLQIKLDKEDILLDIFFADIQFLDIIFNAVICNQLYLFQYCIKVKKNGPQIGKQFIQAYFDIFYQLSLCETTYLEEENSFSPFEDKQICQQTLVYITAYNQNISNMLLNNPKHVILDLFEFD